MNCVSSEIAHPQASSQNPRPRRRDKRAMLATHTTHPPLTHSKATGSLKRLVLVLMASILGASVLFLGPSPRLLLAFGSRAGVSTTGTGKKVLVMGGSGFVGREVCKEAIKQGYQVTSLSRRGENPLPNDPLLQQVEWVQGNALDQSTVNSLVKNKDAVVHAMGLLFDINSGLTNLNLIVSGSRSTPDEDSTYDNITRQTALNILNAIKAARPPFGGKQIPFAFVSAAEAGWPDMKYGPQVEESAPDWLKRYLAAKRSVESMMSSNNAVRPIIYRVPFVDKTVRVEDLAKAIVEGVKESEVAGVQRFPEIESLAADLKAGSTSA